MAVEHIPLRVFLTILRKWLEAVESGDAYMARHFASEISGAGRILAIDPAFQRIFKTKIEDTDGVDAAKALACLHVFFAAVTDAVSVVPNGDDGDEE